MIALVQDINKFPFKENQKRKEKLKEINKKYKYNEINFTKIQKKEITEKYYESNKDLSYS